MVKVMILMVLMVKELTLQTYTKEKKKSERSSVYDDGGDGESDNTNGDDGGALTG